MWVRKICFLILLLCAIFLNGCWDIKTLQDFNYITAIGLDYKKGEFEVFAQQLPFDMVAKSDKGGSKDNKTWIGHAKGKTIDEAIYHIYRSAQKTVFWGQLYTVLFTEDLLKKANLLDVFDSLIRSPEIRYTPWIYGTKQEIKKIFSTKSLFNLSMLDNLLYSPKISFGQLSVIRPIRISHFLRQFREPGQTTLLPEIVSNKKIWLEDSKPKAKFEINGIFACDNKKLLGYMNFNDLEGVRWVNNMQQENKLMLKEGKQGVASYNSCPPKTKIKIHQKKGQFIFDIRVKSSGSIGEIMKPLSEQQLKQLTEKNIEREIKETFKKGQKKKIDIFNLEHELYRKQQKEWKKQTADGRNKLPLPSLRLGKVKAEVSILHYGMYFPESNRINHAE